MLRFVWVWLDLVGSRESCQLSSVTAAAVVHLQLCCAAANSLPFTLISRSLTSHFGKSDQCFWGRGGKIQWNLVLLGFLRYATQGCPLCSGPESQASVAEEKGVDQPLFCSIPIFLA